VRRRGPPKRAAASSESSGASAAASAEAAAAAAKAVVEEETADALVLARSAKLQAKLALKRAKDLWKGRPRPLPALAN
jgi:hypothetical protein